MTSIEVIESWRRHLWWDLIFKLICTIGVVFFMSAMFVALSNEQPSPLIGALRVAWGLCAGLDCALLGLVWKR
jgi:hypothetical protein